MLMRHCAQTFIGIWKMYMLEPKTSMLSRRLFKYLKDTGRVTSSECAGLSWHLCASVSVSRDAIPY